MTAHVVRQVAILTLVLALTGCLHAPSGARVRVSADESAAFGAYHTYVFLPGQVSADPGVVRVSGDAFDRRVAAGLQARLAAKGLHPAGAHEEPDLYVTYTAAVRRDQEIVHAGGRPGPGGYDEPGVIAPGAEWGVRGADEGAFALQFTDARTRAPVWQAAMAADVFSGDRELGQALDAALRNYPPAKR